jgi:FixJ family two-component response regulator
MESREDHVSRVVAVVDDDASVRRSVGNLFQSLGLRVESFASAEAFLDSAERANTGCLVLDLWMPGMKGHDLLVHLADSGQRIPAVILTAHGDDEAREQTMRAGAVAFLRKPFRSDALIDAVKSVMVRI